MNYIVCDLDNTLCKVNTFKIWLLFHLAASIFLSWYFFSQVTLVILLRFNRKIGRWLMKKLILEIYERSFQRTRSLLNNTFTRILLCLIDKKVLEQVMNRHNPKITILATAAPNFYSERLGTILGFNYTLSTFKLDNEWTENLGEQKLNSFKKLVVSWPDAITLIEMFTDHPDDLPLCQYAHKTVLVNPRKGYLAQFYKAGVNPEILYTKSRATRAS